MPEGEGGAAYHKSSGALALAAGERAGGKGER